MDFTFSLKRDKNILIIESSDEIFYQRAINIIDNLYKKYKHIIYQIICTGYITKIELYMQYFISDRKNETLQDLLDEIFKSNDEKEVFYKRLKCL